MEHILGNAASAPIDVDVNNFLAEVVEESSQQPVIVQFWRQVKWASHTAHRPIHHRRDHELPQLT